MADPTTSAALFRFADNPWRTLPALPWQSPLTEPELQEGDVHVWMTMLDQAGPALRLLAQALSPRELVGLDRIRSARNQTRFVVARGALRTILGRYLGQSPASLLFEYGAAGKPALAPTSGGARVQFNLSHSGGALLLAVTQNQRIGVDIEQVRRLPDPVRLAGECLTPEEQAALSTLSPERAGAALLRCWTRKEAFAKAQGQGLLYPIRSIRVAPEEPAGPFSWMPCQADALEWWLETLPLPTGYVGALAVEGPYRRLSCWTWQVC